MPLFRYEIVDKNGKILSGAMQSPSEADVRRTLIEKGFSVNMVRDTTPANSGHVVRSVGPAAASSLKRTGSRRSAPAKELALFFRQLAQQANAGIGLHQALTQLASNTPHQGMRLIIDHLAANVDSGGTLNEGMAEYPRAFPPHIVGTVAAGEVAGLLPLVLGDIALDYELALKASSRIAKFVTWNLWISSFSLLLFVPAVPLMVRGAFAAMQAGSTGGMSFVSKMMQPLIRETLHVTLPLTAGLILLYHVPAWILKQPNMRRTYHTLVLKMPYFGRASRERSIASFTRILWRLQTAGVMPIKAWQVASRVPENSVIAERLQAQTDLVANGGKYSEALARAEAISQDDIRLLTTAESTGHIVDSLQRIAAYYEDAALSSAERSKKFGMRIAILVFIIAIGAALIGSSTYVNELMNGVDKYMGVGP